MLDLPLPSADLKSNILTEVLHTTTSPSELLLPFNEALTQPTLEIWQKLMYSVVASRSVARRYKPAPGDPVFLSSHPMPESLVV